MTKNLNDKEYHLVLRCPTCGDDSHFETNEETVAVTCTKCNSFFPRGKDELLEYNEEAIEEVKDEIANDARAAIEAELRKAFKGNKFFKLK